MTDNDLFYVCSLIEFTARKTLNKRGVIVERLGLDGIKRQLKNACVNHCLSFEQVCYEITEFYSIPMGEFDTITKCKYTIPSFQDIGKLYAILIESMNDTNSIPERVYNIFSSFLSDEISKFSTDLYYQNPIYLLACFDEGKIIDY